MELKPDNKKEVKARKAGLFAGMAVLAAGLALASCASQKDTKWATETAMVQTVRRHAMYSQLDCKAEATRKVKALLCGVQDNATVKVGDTILALEANKPREFYYLLKVGKVDDKGIEIRTVIDVLGLAHDESAVTPFRVNFGETREYNVEGTSGGFAVKVERGAEAGTAIVSLINPEPALKLTLN